MPSLTVQYPVHNRPPPDHTVRKYTHTVGILNFISILLSSLYLSPQNSIVPSGFLPTILCYSHFTIHCMSTSIKLLHLLLFSFNTRRITETANSHISSSQISCKESSTSLKAIQHPIKRTPEVSSPMVK